MLGRIKEFEVSCSLSGDNEVGLVLTTETVDTTIKKSGKPQIITFKREVRETKLEEFGDLDSFVYTKKVRKNNSEGMQAVKWLFASAGTVLTLMFGADSIQNRSLSYSYAIPAILLASSGIMHNGERRRISTVKAWQDAHQNYLRGNIATLAA